MIEGHDILVSADKRPFSFELLCSGFGGHPEQSAKLEHG